MGRREEEEEQEEEGRKVAKELVREVLRMDRECLQGRKQPLALLKHYSH